MTSSDDQERELRLVAESLAEFYEMSLEDALTYIRKTLVGDAEPARVTGP